MLNLNKYAKSLRQEGGDKVQMSSKGLPRLGTLFSQILSSLSFHDSPEDIGIDKVNKPMKILSIYFPYNWQTF